MTNFAFGEKQSPFIRIKIGFRLIEFTSSADGHIDKETGEKQMFTRLDAFSPAY